MARRQWALVVLMVCGVYAMFGLALYGGLEYMVDRAMESGLITESVLAETMVSNDAVYAGSLTFAGLVLWLHHAVPVGYNSR